MAFFRRLLIPPSIIGGLLLFLAGPQAAAWIDPSIVDIWKKLPSILISFFFAGIILEERKKNLEKHEALSVFLQSNFVWFVALLQLSCGLFAAIFLKSFVSDPVNGHIVEIGWAGGPGAAASFRAVLERLGKGEFADLAILSAVAGMIWGSFSGIIYSNILKRKLPAAEPLPGSGREKNSPLTEDVSESSEHGFLLAGSLIGVSVLVALLFHHTVTRAVSFTGEAAAKIAGDLPLFFFALVAALLVRKGVEKTRFASALSVDAGKINSGILNCLVVSAFASLDLGVIGAHASDFTVLMICAAVVTALQLFYFSRRMLPLPIWREIGLINYGMATGTTALGIVLLKNLTSPRENEAMRIYALAVPFSAPFIGGGVVSFILPEFTANGHGLILAGICALASLILFLVARLFQRRTASNLPQ